MSLLNPLFITILIFGIYTSYIDIKDGKIKNLSVLLLIISGLLINIFLSNTLSTFDFNMKSDFVQSIVNIIITFMAGFFLWLAGLWSSGDAKLFLGYSVLLPIFTYKHGYLSFFPSVVILINTFIPIAVFYVFNSFLYIKSKNLKASVKQVFSPKNVINLFLSVFGLFFILQLFLNYFNINLNFVLQMIIIFVLMEVLDKISSKATLTFSIVGSVLRILLSFSSIFTLTFIFQFSYTAIGFLFLKLILGITEFYAESVKIKDLKSGMVLSERLIKNKKGIEKK